MGNDMRNKKRKVFNAGNKPRKRGGEWISDLTEDEKTAFDNVLSTANKLKDKELTKKERHVAILVARNLILTKRKDKEINKPVINNPAELRSSRSISSAEKILLNDALYNEIKVKGRILTKNEKKEVLNVAREKIISQRKANQITSARTQERHAAVFEWKKPEPFRR